MSNKLTTEEKELLASIRTGGTKEEIFDSIAATIRKSYDYMITEEEARKAARNVICFCQKLIEVQVRIDREKEKQKINN